MITFDQEDNFTEEEKRRMIEVVTASPNKCYTIGEYECSVNPSTYEVFEDIHGEKYEDVLKRFLSLMINGCKSEQEFYMNIYRFMGYSENDFREDRETGRFEVFLGNVIDEVMFNYDNGEFHKKPF